MVGRWGPVGVSALVPAPGVLLECRPRWLPRPLRSPLRVWRCRLVPRACAALKCGCGRPCCGAGGRGAGRRLPRLLASGVRACNNLENVRCVQCARHRIAHDIPGKIVLMSSASTHASTCTTYNPGRTGTNALHSHARSEARSQICKDEEVEGDGTTENSEHREGIKFQLWDVVE